MADLSRPVRFLLAEDDEDHADLVARAMRDNRISNHLVHVTDGEQALAYLRKQAPYTDAVRPDIVLLDLKMPKVDGHQVLEALKNDDDLKSIPTVILTTSAAEADRARAYAAHANSYLVKPLDFSRFHEMVNQLRLYWAVWNTPPA